MRHITTVFPLLSFEFLVLDSSIFDDSEVFRPLSLALSQLPALHSLEFDLIEFTLQQITDFTASFQHLPHLTSLSLRSVQSVDWLPFFNSLPHLCGLISLQFSCRINAEDCIALASCLLHLTSLSTLILNHTAMDDGCTALCGALPALASSLTSLDFTGNLVRDSGCLTLHAVLPHLTSLRTLNTSHNLHGTHARSALTDAVSHLPTLQQFDL